jgi:hypothetical protein
MKSTLPKIYITNVEQNGTAYDYAWCHRSAYDVTFNSGHTCKMNIGYIESNPDYNPDYIEDEGYYEYWLSAYAIECEELSDDECEYLNELVNNIARIQKSKKCSEDDEPEFDDNEEEKLIDEIETDLYNEANKYIDMYNKYDDLFYDITSKEHFDMQVTLSGEYLPDILEIYGEKNNSVFEHPEGVYKIDTDNYEAIFNDKYEMTYFYNYNTDEEYEKEVA